jgi:hypothetical protein
MFKMCVVLYFTKYFDDKEKCCIIAHISALAAMRQERGGQ